MRKQRSSVERVVYFVVTVRVIMTYIQLSKRFSGNLAPRFVFWGHNKLNTSRGRKAFQKKVLSLPSLLQSDSKKRTQPREIPSPACGSLYLSYYDCLIKDVKNVSFTFLKYCFDVWAETLGRVMQTLCQYFTKFKRG